MSQVPTNCHKFQKIVTSFHQILRKSARPFESNKKFHLNVKINKNVHQIFSSEKRSENF